MLLSMYASYQLANRNKTTYVLRIVVFVLLSSFLSAILPISQILFLTFPFTFLSFPLYAYIDPIFIEGREWVDYLGIRFFPIGLAYPLPMGLGHTFPLFLCVNIVGAVLGYVASRICRIREWGTIKTWSLLGFILAIAFIGVGYWLGSSMPLITKSGEVIYGFGRGPYGFDGWALIFYGIIVLAIVIGKILWSKTGTQ